MALDSFMAKERALATAAAFTGAAIYINVAEQPARLGLDDKALLAQWKPSYALGLPMQSGLALASALFFANWPYTLLVILPINKRIAAISPDAAVREARDLIETWGRLHAGRSVL